MGESASGPISQNGIGWGGNRVAAPASTGRVFVNVVAHMMGNGLANITAATIVASAIVWTGGFDRNKTVDEKQVAEMYARAVGDIRNDIVINCGCCGEDGQRRADTGSF